MNKNEKNVFLKTVKVKCQTQGQGQIKVKGQGHLDNFHYFVCYRCDMVDL